ncbi:hypothetical protein ACUXOQ_001239 [Dermabacter hominis]
MASAAPFLRLGPIYFPHSTISLAPPPTPLFPQLALTPVALHKETGLHTPT